ncbi:MAG: Gfo/Idh/MocA family oxidoreductase, partial [bacterium]
MIIIDKALQHRHEQGNPIRVGLVGAGFMGRGIAHQIIQYTPGMQLAAIANRHISAAKQAYEEAGVADFALVENSGQL